MSPQPTKRPAPRRLASADPPPAGSAPRGLPGGSSNPSKPGRRDPLPPPVLTQRVKVLEATGGRPMTCHEAGVRDGQLVASDSEGKDVLVPLPDGHVLRTVVSNFQLNGLKFSAGELVLGPADVLAVLAVK